MGVTPEQLAKAYPKLYHMAEPETWGSIKKHGLLCTSALLDLFEVDGMARKTIEEEKRPESVPINHAKYGRVTIRDQKPLDAKLVNSLQGCTPEEWCRLLNGRVFFWLTIERLFTLLCAKTYAKRKHAVLTVDTLSLANAYQDRITLAAMNTGNTRPFAHPRSPDTFKEMAAYPFEERAKYGLYRWVVESAVERGVPDIEKFTLSVDEMTCANGKGQVLKNIFKWQEAEE
jgi:hypothetical protein